MNKSITKELKCLVLKNGIEIWKEKEKFDALIEVLKNGKNGFVKIDDELINVNDIVGIFSPKTIEDMIRRKNGQWKCNYGKWHDKGEKCKCKIEKLSGEKLARYSRGF